MPARHDYDLAVIGGGSGGLSGAVGATKLGLSVVLVNGGPMGGDCLNFGCVPSKALLHAAKTAKAARKGAAFGIHADGLRIDYEAVKAHIRSVQDGIREHEDAAWFRKMGMDVVEDYAEFVDPHRIAAGDARITAARYLLATGSRAFVPPIPGLEEAGFVTNEQVFDMPELPKRLVAIGGGPIGIEMAWAHLQLGSEVVVIEGGPEILGKDDPEAAAVLRQSMEEDGARFLLDAKVVRVERTSAGKRVVYSRDGREESVDADQLLVATGRRPNVEKLKLENAGVEYTPRGIRVDASQRTTAKHIWAVGDVAGGLQFTHAAGLEAGTFIRSAVFRLPAKTSCRAFPWCTYTDPEVASAGLSEARARAEGIPHIVARADFAENDRARAEGRTAGFAKVILEPPKLFGLRGGRILGAQIVGPHAGELVHEFVVAIHAGVTATQFSGMTHAYPSLAEINKRAISTHLAGKLFTDSTRRWLARLFGYGRSARPARSPEGSHGHA